MTSLNSPCYGFPVLQKTNVKMENREFKSLWTDLFGFPVNSAELEPFFKLLGFFVLFIIKSVLINLPKHRWL